MFICLERSANDLHMVQLMPLPCHHLYFSKIQNGLSFWYRPTQKKRKKAVKRLCVVYAVKVVHLVFAGLRDDEGYGAPAGGCHANNVR